MRLVVGIKRVAERLLALVEDDRQMRRPILLRHVAHQLPQHVAEAQHRIDLQTVGFAVQRRQRVIGAENIGRAIDQKDVVALCRGIGGGRSGDRFGGFRHLPNLGRFAGNGDPALLRRHHPRARLGGRDPQRLRAREQEARTLAKGQPPDRQRTDDACEGDDQRHPAEIGDDAGF